MPRKPVNQDKEKPHRKHREGTYRQKPNGTFICQATVNGRRVNHIVKTEDEAEKWLRETRVDADRGLLPVDAARVTIGAFLAKWLEASTPALRPKTVDLYPYMTRRHLTPVLGKVRLDNLRADHL